MPEGFTIPRQLVVFIICYAHFNAKRCKTLFRLNVEHLRFGKPGNGFFQSKHPKWDERPLLVIVLKDGKSASRQAILDYMQGKIAKWWMPDDVQFISEIPHTATGKINKIKLREHFKDYTLPDIAKS